MIAEDNIIVSIMTEYGHIEIKFDNIHNLKTRNIIAHDEIYIEGLIDYNGLIDLGINTESYGNVAGTNSFSATCELFNKVDISVFGYAHIQYLNLVTDMKNPFIFYRSNVDKTYSIELTVPIHEIDRDGFNLTIEFIVGVNENFNPDGTGSPESLRGLLQDLGEKYYDLRLNYDPASRKSLFELVNYITNETKKSLSSFPVESGELPIAFSIGVNNNSFNNEPIEIIIIDHNYLDVQVEYFDALEFLTNNSLDVISALRYSTIPLEEIINLYRNYNYENVDFNDIGLVLLLKYNQQDRSRILLDKFIDLVGSETSARQEYNYFVYKDLNNLIKSSNLNEFDHETLSGYVTRPTDGNTNEIYTKVFITYDQTPLSPWIISSSKGV
jgi:hypothetical protein